MERFDDITYLPLRVYNRTITALNLIQDSGIPAAEDYINSFKEEDRKYMQQMMKCIKKLGREYVSTTIRKAIPEEGRAYA